MFTMRADILLTDSGFISDTVLG